MKKLMCRMFGHDLRITKWEEINNGRWLHQFTCRKCGEIQNEIMEKVTFWRRVNDFAD